MPSILFVNRVAGARAGATGRLLDDLASRLVRSGWSVTILACAPWCTVEGERDRRVRTVPVAAPAGRGLAAAGGQVAALARAALALPVHDVAVSLSDPPMLATLAPVLRRRAGTLVHWCHDLYPDLLPIVADGPGGLAVRIAAPAATAALRAHDGVIAAAPCLADRLAERLADGPPLAVLENWPDPAVRPDDAAGAAWRARLGLRASCVVMYAGTLGRVHDAGVLVEAAHRLSGRPDIALVLAGGGGEGHARLRRQAARSGLAGVHVVPWQPAAALSGLLSAADLHLALLDARAEGMSAPCKVATARAAGRPVLFAGPAGSGPARQIASTGAGAVVAPSGAALAAAVERYADDLPARHAAASAARSARPPDGADAAASRFEALVAAFAARRRPADAVGRAGAGVAPALT